MLIGIKVEARLTDGWRYCSHGAGRAVVRRSIADRSAAIMFAIEHLSCSHNHYLAGKRKVEEVIYVGRGWKVNGGDLAFCYAVEAAYCILECYPN